MLWNIYLIIGVIYGVWFLYKEVMPDFGVVTAIFLSPIILAICAFLWSFVLLSKLPMAQEDGKYTTNDVL